MRALDLFCGAGGASKGLANAGFEVTGVDLRAQPRYPFAFIQGDALAQDLSGFDFVWASPPCQAHTALKTMPTAKKHIDLIPATREKLKAWGGKWIIENVVGAPLICPIMLCGSMFGLSFGDVQLRRHRLFELSDGWVMPPFCNHNGKTIGVYGGGHGVSLHRAKKGERYFTVAECREAMGIDWMTCDELSQAIPPAYSEYLARKIVIVGSLV